MRAPLVAFHVFEYELIDQVRNISLDLRPALLDDFGLLPALNKLFERYTAQNGITVDFASQGIEGIRFGSEVETAIFRIIQEALTNVARHAGVSKVCVRLWVTTEGDVRLQVEDEGYGFDVQAVGKTTNGLSIMRERAMLLSGTFAIQSEINQGTILMASIPAAQHTNS